MSHLNYEHSFLLCPWILVYFIFFQTDDRICTYSLFSKFGGTTLHTICIFFSLKIKLVVFFMLKHFHFILVTVEYSFVSTSWDCLYQYLTEGI